MKQPQYILTYIASLFNHLKYILTFSFSHGSFYPRTPGQEGGVSQPVVVAPEKPGHPEGTCQCNEDEPRDPQHPGHDPVLALVALYSSVVLPPGVIMISVTNDHEKYHLGRDAAAVFPPGHELMYSLLDPNSTPDTGHR